MELTHTIERQWMKDDGDRLEGLERARFCASLSKPWVLPPDDFSRDGKLPEVYTSLIARGVTNLEGRLLLSLFTPAAPWFKLKPASKFLYDANINPAAINEFRAHLALHELIMMSKLEKANMGGNNNHQRSGFRDRKRMALSQLLVTGDTLEQFTDDYQMKVFRRDQYVSRRDPAGNVIYHIVKESVDPVGLDPKQAEMADIDIQVEEARPVGDRMKDMYTEVMWHPVSKVWVIRQEINRHVINESQEGISPFLSTPFELAPGENYGRGWVELNLGDCRTLNELNERLLDFAATASKQLFVTDYNSQVRPIDLAKPSGSVIQGRVQGGQVQDVACLKVDKLSDFNVVYNTMIGKRNDLAVGMLMEGESMPTGERVTAFQVQRVAMELEGALGGIYAPIADNQQVPLIERLMYQMTRDKLLPALPPDSVEVEAVTGLAALSREADATRLMGVLQVLRQFGPEMLARLDMGVLMDTMMRQAGIYEPGLVKSAEQLRTEQEAAMADQQSAAVQGEAVRTVGAVAEKRLTEGATSE